MSLFRARPAHRLLTLCALVGSLSLATLPAVHAEELPDTTPPTIIATVAPQPNEYGWNNTPVTISYACADAGSGIDLQYNSPDYLDGCPRPDVTPGEGGFAFVGRHTRDRAYNYAWVDPAPFVKVDMTAPTLTPVLSPQPNGAGWNNQNVEVTFQCVDGRSGIDPRYGCPATQSVTAEGLTSFNGLITRDQAGNMKDAEVSVRLDKTAPTVGVLGVENGATYLVGQVPSASCSTADALSKPATLASLTITGGAADGTGAFVATCSGATDNAGNSAAPVSVAYSVASGAPHYAWSGFFQPIDNVDASGRPVLNVVKAGSSVPVKFSLGGNQGLDIFEAGYPRSSSMACDATAALDSIEETATAGASQLSYDASSDRYSYVWKTDRSWAGSCRQQVVKLKDGSVHTANFKFAK
jgi:hypothetical protein